MEGTPSSKLTQALPMHSAQWASASRPPVTGVCGGHKWVMVVKTGAHRSPLTKCPLLPTPPVSVMDPLCLVVFSLSTVYKPLPSNLRAESRFS